MTKIFVVAGIVLTLLSAQALAASFPSAPLYPSFTSPPNDTPTLSGNYINTWMQNCDPTDSKSSFTSGVLNFNPTTHKAALSGYNAEVSGKIYKLSPESETGAYSNTGTTITLNGNTYQATFGSISNGIAFYVSYIAVTDDGQCVQQGWLSHQ